MNYYLALLISLFSSGLPVLFAIPRYRLLDKASKIIFLLLALAFVTECSAAIVAQHLHNNMSVYNISNLGQVFLISLYFNYCIYDFKKYNVGILIGILSIVAGLVNMWLLQPIDTYNTYYFLYQTIIVLGMGMYLYRQFLLQKTYFRIGRSPHFWFVLVLFFFYVFNFFTMSLYDYDTRHLKEYKKFVDYSIVLLSAITNLAFTAVFYFYPRLTLRQNG